MLFDYNQRERGKTQRDAKRSDQTEISTKIIISKLTYKKLI